MLLNPRRRNAVKILMIENDAMIVESVGFAFQTAWPDVVIVSADWGREGINMVEAESPDIVILGLGLPDINGLDVIKRIRQFSQTPVLVLSANEEEMTVVQAFALGAGDYVYKPFRPMELIARVKRLILEKYETGIYSPVIEAGFMFDPAKRQFTYKNDTVELRNIESIILAELLKHSPEVVAYLDLAKAVWGDEYMSSTDCLKVHVYNLRKTLEESAGCPQMIFNKSGTGYYALLPA